MSTTGRDGSAAVPTPAPRRSTSPSPTGAQYPLTAGEAVAVVTEVGAALRSFRIGERDVVVPFGEDERPPAVHGAVLVPWPNRVGDGRYEWDGRTRQLDLSEPDRHNAIHGLVRHTRWQLLRHEVDEVELGLDLVPRDGYPHPLRHRVRYALGADRLTVSLVTENLGDNDAPYGAGFHPWLSPGRHPLDACEARVDAAGWVRADDRLLPVETTAEIPAGVDLRTPRRLRGLELDDAYVIAGGDRPGIHLTDPDGVTASVRALEGFTRWQVFTGDGIPAAYERSGLAAEPMTCGADAFRTGDELVVLAPGDAHTCRFELTLLPPPERG
ncbi:aldose 1-epimerase family protein [Mobilicoccus sp.]|uniref:aldose 1-epimerase family protein n=1 Tax=Mobilicoccus sp. TaxID=2034349 RepID=UPI0028AB3D4D|nr:aldose 1-epimerase family protein [Mobilicoccus sp.]